MNDPNSSDGAWIGIDLGTTHCSVAVWDSVRGHAKWMRLPGLAAATTEKVGRLIRSHGVVTTNWKQEEGDNNNASVQKLSGGLHVVLGKTVDEILLDNQDVSPSHVPSIKKLLTSETETISVQPLNWQSKQAETEKVSIATIDLVTALLRALLSSATHYLTHNVRRKGLCIPTSKTLPFSARHAVVGVPATYTRRQRQLVVQAAKNAGFETTNVMIESTAAALTYGLGGSLSAHRNGSKSSSDGSTLDFVVVDVGGGTTDVTVLRRTHEGSFQVLATHGDANLGGDNLDEALQLYLIQRKTIQPILVADSRRIKEELCTENSQSYVACHGETKVRLTDLDEAFATHIGRVEKVVVAALAKVEDSTLIDEVILIGGTTRVPALRRMLLNLFSVSELCTSVNPMSAVAQGCAIQAAVLSSRVPLHEIASALMLDKTPFALGIQTTKTNGGDKSKAANHFVSMIPAGTLLPAKGTTMFELEDSRQAGVTVAVVELVDSMVFVPVETFTFLVHRVNNDTKREIEITLCLETTGELRVSIYDDNDPEHVVKRHEAVGGSLEWSWQQAALLMACILLFGMYVSIKVAFADKEILLQQLHTTGEL